MESIPNEILYQVIQILGDVGIDREEIESRISPLVTDPITVNRLVAWPPEAFATVFISHGWDVDLPLSFSAKTRDGEWIEVDFDREPIFMTSVEIARQMYNNGPRELFKQVSLRSSMLQALNTALNSGADITGATIGGPALIDIPADIYQSVPQQSSPKKSFLRRLFS